MDLTQGLDIDELISSNLRTERSASPHVTLKWVKIFLLWKMPEFDMPRKKSGRVLQFGKRNERFRFLIFGVYKKSSTFSFRHVNSHLPDKKDPTLQCNGGGAAIFVLRFSYQFVYIQALVRLHGVFLLTFAFTSSCATSRLL